MTPGQPAPDYWWKQWSVAGTGDIGLRGLFPRGIKALVRMPSPKARPMTL